MPMGYLVKKLYVPCLVFLLLAGGFDLACTLVSDSGGWLHEKNPVAAHVLESFGQNGLMAFKITTTSISCVAIWFSVRLGWRRQPKVILAGMSITVAAHVWLTAHWFRYIAEFA